MLRIGLLLICIAAGGQDWTSYGNDPGGMRYSTLAQINRVNVRSLKRAWTFHTRELTEEVKPNERRLKSLQVTPLCVDGVLYISTPGGRVVAVDGDTGKTIWEYDSQAGRPRRVFHQHRGVAYWRPGSRILFGTNDGRLIALDAKTGKPSADFGDNGVVDLKTGAGGDRFPSATYSVNAPPAIYKDLAIVGAEVPEGSTQGTAGVIRAFHAKTGKLVWEFHTIPRPGEFGHDTWEGESWKHRTGVNVWTIMTVDTQNGLVFLPIGSASYDFYGGDRRGANLFANSLVALDASTGKRVWHFQAVHHDVWDYDLPAPPLLCTLQGQPAVVLLTKMGLVFAFNRLTGKPLFPIEERPVPQSSVPGEKTWPTQPFPLKPPPLALMELRREDMKNEECAQLFDSMEHKGAYTPWSAEKNAIIMPGTLGGATWSGGSFDPRNGTLYVNVNEFGAIGMMRKQPDGSPLEFVRTNPQGTFMRFGDRNEQPCQKGPWGTLQAIDMNKGERLWKVPLGPPETGSPNIGGSIVTSGGLVFIAGSTDSRFRAFDSSTGKVLWEVELEASGHAMPMTYRGKKSGRQFVVIAAGGGGFFTRKHADVVAAYSLE